MSSTDDFSSKRRAESFSAKVVLIGLCLLVMGLLLAPNQMSSKEFLLLALVCLYGEWRSVRLPGYGFVNPGEGFYLAAACFYGPVPGAVLAASLGVVGDLRKSKPSVVRWFNIGWALSTFSAVGLVFPRLGLMGSALCYCLVAGLLQAHGEHHFSQLPLAQTVRRQGREMVLLAPTVFILAYLTSLFFSFKAEAVLLMVFPVELLVAYVRQRELTKHLESAMADLALAQSELVASGRKAALGVMAAGIAHEINSPLAAAVTNIHMLKMSSNKATKGNLDLLEKSISRCQTIVARMLKYSRKAPHGGVPCRLKELLPDAVLFCGRPFHSDGVKLELRAEDVSVVADPTELVQVLSNLLANAHDSGADLVELDCEVEDDIVELRIRDNGQGISDDVAAHIFDPFFTTKAVGTGTGLGLSIAQGLAAGFGGELRLHQTSPSGSIFVLTLRRDL